MLDALERLRAANPVPECPPPSIQDVWKRVELDRSSDKGRHHGNRPSARSPVALPSISSVVAVFATVTAIAVAVVALALLGHRHTDIPASRAGQPPALFTLHAQAGQLLGPNPGLPARVQALRGYPIVVNAWASWCQPCRNDLGRFASASSRYGQKVAFLGADLDDTAKAASSFLAQHTISYPSYETTSKQLRSILPKSLSGLPATIFIDRAGNVVHVHAGEYDSLATLEHDIATYLQPHSQANQPPSITQMLTAELGILRHAQSPAARAFNHSRQAHNLRLHFAIDPNLTRAVHVPHGIRVWLYIVTAGRSAAATTGVGISERQLLGGGGFGECCVTPAMLKHPSSPGPIARSSATHPHQVYLEIVPDGVAHVRWVFPRGSNGVSIRPFPHRFKTTVTVHDNVAAAILPDRGAAQTIVWYDTHGRRIATHTTR